MNEGRIKELTEELNQIKEQMNQFLIKIENLQKERSEKARTLAALDYNAAIETDQAVARDAFKEVDKIRRQIETVSKREQSLRNAQAVAEELAVEKQTEIETLSVESRRRDVEARRAEMMVASRHAQDCISELVGALKEYKSAQGELFAAGILLGGSRGAPKISALAKKNIMGNYLHGALHPLYEHDFMRAHGKIRQISLVEIDADICSAVLSSASDASANRLEERIEKLESDLPGAVRAASQNRRRDEIKLVIDTETKQKESIA